MKHLFIEGPARSGKSKLLREHLAEFEGLLGGFVYQRLYDEDGMTKGFRIAEANDFSLEMVHDESLSGIFRIQTRHEGRQRKIETLNECGIDILKDAEQCGLILLDEIGGPDLLAPDLKARIYELLAGDTPCIGILKDYENARLQSKPNTCTEKMSALNMQLHMDLRERFDAKIIRFGPDTGKRIDAFLDEKVPAMVMRREDKVR